MSTVANRISRVMLLLAALLLALQAFAQVSDNATQRNIIERMMRGETVTPEEKASVYSEYLREAKLRSESTPPVFDLAGGPDAFGYRFMDQSEVNGPVYNWVTHTASATTVTAWNSTDDGYAGPFTLPMSFSLYGTPFSDFYLGTNGYITDAATGSIPSGFPNASLPRGIYFCARDMHVGYGGTTVQMEYFTTPTARFVITYEGLAVYNTSNYRISAQIILNASGTIVVQYRNIAGSPQGGVGIQNSNAGISLGYSTTPYNGTTILYYSDCPRVTNVAPANGSIGIGTTPTLTWLRGSCTATSSVYFSSNSALVNSLDPSARIATALTDTFYTFSAPIALNSVYYWRVVGFDTSGSLSIPGTQWSFNTYVPVGGTKTIGGASPDYATFTDAANALSLGGLANGGVTFNVRPGTYNELVTMNRINNSSSANTIVFQKEPGSVGQVLISSAGTSGTTDAVVKLNGSEWVTFDGIDIGQTGSSSSNYVEYGYFLTNANSTQGARHNVIKNSTITLNRANASSIGVYQVYSYTPSGSGGANSYNQYLNLRISNCFSGLNLTGYAGYPDSSTEVGSDSIGTGYANRFVVGSGGADDIGGNGTPYGVFVSGQVDPNLHDFDVRNVYSITNTGTVYGLYLASNYGLPQAKRCRISDVYHRGNGNNNSGQAIGCYIDANSAPVYFTNSMLFNINSTAARSTISTTHFAVGAYVTGGTTYFDNNSVSIAAGASPGSGDPYYYSSDLYLNSGTLNARNNVFYNRTYSQASAKHYGMYRNSGTLNAVNYNVYYNVYSTGGYIGYYGSDQATLASWRTATSMDANSQSADPRYVDSSMDLHIQTGVASTPVDNLGTPLAHVPNDIDGQTRHSVLPDIGADEGTFVTAPMMPLLSTPVNTALDVANPVQLSWQTGANTSSTSLYVSENQTDVTNMAPAALIAASLTATSYSISLTPGVVYYWRVVAVNASTSETTASSVWSFRTHLDALTGTKTIGGASPDYATFAAALNALSIAGVGNGGVTFHVRGGTYNERFTVSAVLNASAFNPVIFRKQPGDPAVVVNGAGTAASNEAVITLSGCSYVTFDGIDVLESGTSSSDYTEYGYMVTNASATQGARYNVIKNATITMTRAHTLTYGVYHTYNAAPTAHSGTQSYNKYINLQIRNSQNGMMLNSYTTYSDSLNEVGSDVMGLDNTSRFSIGAPTGDDIGGPANARGLYIVRQTNIWVHDIDVRNVFATTSSYEVDGIYATTLYGTGNAFQRNRIYEINSRTGVANLNGYVYGMFFTGSTGETSISNNMIYNVNSITSRSATIASLYVNGLYASGGTYYIDNNSITVAPGSSPGTGDPLYYSTVVNLATGTHYLRNNVFTNRCANQASMKHYVVYANGATLAQSNYNVFYNHNATLGFIGYAAAADRTTLANWQSATGTDANSFSSDPLFIDPTSNLHIQTLIPSTPVENSGTVLAAVTNDIDGQSRSATTPDIGADEGIFVTVPTIPVLVSPGFGAVDVPLPAQLAYTTGSFTNNVDVYLSTVLADVNSMAPAALFQAAYSGGSPFSAVGLTPGATYYWRLLARNTTTGETSVSTVWNFRAYLQPVAGTKTIGGASPDYATFSDALTAMSIAGVGAGGVTFNVRPGTYNERITMNQYVGMSQSNPVTFQRESGTVLLSSAGTASTDAMIKLNGCSWVTFDGINVTQTGTSTSDFVEYGYWVTNSSATIGAQHNTIKNATITLTRSAGTYGVYSRYTATPTSTTGSQSYNRYLNLRISTCANGLYMLGHSTYMDDGNEIGSDVVGTSNPNRMVIGSGGVDDIGGYTGLHTYGLTISYQGNLNVHDLDVQNLYHNNSSYAVYAVYLANMTGTDNYFVRNRINGAIHRGSGTNSSGTVIGLYVAANTGSMNVYNNMVSNVNSVAVRSTQTTSNFVYGAYVASGTVNFDHNSISITPGYSASADPMFSSQSFGVYGGTLNFRNNILMNFAYNQVSTARHWCYYYSAGTISTQNYNLYYFPYATGGAMGYYTADRTSLALWQSYTGVDLQSLQDNPRVINTLSDLHIESSTVPSPVESAGTPLVAVNTDIDGNSRTGTNPDIGADEGNFAQILVTSPIGYEVWPAATSQNHSRLITWRSITPGVNVVDLYYSTNSGATFPTVIATSLPDTGSYRWFMPAVNSSSMRIKAVLRTAGGTTVGYDSSRANFTLDATPPTGTITLTAPTSGSIVSPRPTFTWTQGALSGAARFEVVKFVSSNWVKITQTNNATTYTATPLANEALPNSPPAVTWRVHAVDAAGNWLASGQTWTLSVDGIAPDTFSLASPVNNFWTNATTPTLGWTASSDPSGTVTYDVYVDSVRVAQNVAITTYTLATPLTIGTHNWYIVAKDPIGNTRNANTSRAIRIGNFDVVQPTENQWLYDSTLTFRWNSTTPSGLVFQRYEFKIDGVLKSTQVLLNDTTYILPAAQALANGSHTAQVWSYDTSGFSYISPVRNLRIDRVAPNAFNLSSPANNAYAATLTPTLSWVAATDAGVGISHYEVWLDGALLRDSVMTNSFTLLVPISEGAHTWTVYARDLFGNRRQANSTWNFVVDTNPPTAATLISPINGDTTSTGRPTVRWYRSTDTGSGIGYYRIFVNSVQRGGNQPVASDTLSYTLTDSLVNGFYNWYVVTYDLSGRTTSSNYGYFNVVFGSITISRPNGGETLYAGVTDSVRWTSASITGNVKIELNRSYPTGSWETITASTPNDGSELFTVTGPGTTSARVRVTSLNNRTVMDESNGNVTIVAPTVTVTRPNGGEYWYIDAADTIRWTSNVTGTVSIKVNTNYPSGSWTTLASNVTATLGSYVWTPVTGFEGNAVRFAIISNSYTSARDTSDGNLTIQPRTITLTRPNGGEQLVAFTNDTIRWTSNFTEGSLVVALSRNGEDINSAEVLPNGDGVPLSQGYFVWNVFLPASSTARILLYEVNTNTVDWSDSNFSIVSAPMSITVTRPNDVATWVVGETDTIRWTQQNITGAVRISLNRDYPSGTWEVLDTTRAGSTGWFAWTPTGPATTNARIQVQSMNAPSIADESNASFTIIQRSIALTRPNGGETFRVGLPDTIRYSGQYMTNGMRIELNRNYPTGSWETLVDSVGGNSTQWVWNNVTAPVSTNARVRVSGRNLPVAYRDTSNAAFNIQPNPSLYANHSVIGFGNKRPGNADSVLVVIGNRSNLAFRYQSITGLSAGMFSKRVVNTDTLIASNDSLRIWVKFRPDSTLSYLDTLRITFESPYTSIAVPMSGLGYGYYTFLSTASLTFPTVLEPTRRDSLTFRVRVAGTQPMSSSTWRLSTAGLPFRVSPTTLPTINGGDSVTVKLYFEPTAQGSFSGQIQLMSSALNEDTLRLSVSGISQYVPAAPGGLSITSVGGEDARLNWAVVDTSVNGVPLTVQRYLVFYRSNQSYAWEYHGYTSGATSTTYTHIGVVRHSRAMFYQVTAWVGDVGGFDRVIREIPQGTPEAEVLQRLRTQQLK